MYFHYCMVAVGAIIAISLVMFLILKKNNQVNRGNIANLVICTVLSMICAVVVPLMAEHIAEGLYFSMPAAIAVSVIASAGAAIIIFLLLKPAIKKWALKAADEPDTNQESLVEQLMQAQSDAAPTVEPAISRNDTDSDERDLTIINEAIITNEAEDMNAYSILPSEPEQVLTVNYQDHNQEDLIKLLDKAIESKSQRDLYGAISNYEAALIMNPDDELRYLILLDLCSLYKKTNQPDSVSRILESSQCQLLDLEKKEDILRNL